VSLHPYKKIFLLHSFDTTKIATVSPSILRTSWIIPCGVLSIGSHEKCDIPQYHYDNTPQIDYSKFEKIDPFSSVVNGIDIDIIHGHMDLIGKILLFNLIPTFMVSSYLRYKLLF